MGPESNSPEIVCQSQQGGVITSGGGFSTFFSRPSWQTDAVTYYMDNLSGGDVPTSGYNPLGRGYPDFSMIGVNYQVYMFGSLIGLYGTSCTVPVIAAFVSLVNADRLSRGLGSIGFLNPTLYAVGINNTLGIGNIYGDAVFNDSTSGHNKCCAYSGSNPAANAVCCNSGFTAAAGWDTATGWGSINYPEFYKMFSSGGV